MRIPKIIHQIWFQGEDKIPEHMLVYHRSWKEKCPDYILKVWGETEIKELMETVPEWIGDTYNSYDKMIQKIDFAKYAILYVHGGIYIDMDVKCLKSLNHTPGLQTKKAIFSIMPYNTCQKLLLMTLGMSFNRDIINNGIIFCEPKSDIMLDTMKEAVKNKDNIFKGISNMLYVFASTGPVCLTKAVYRYNGDDIQFLDNTYFEACDIDSVRNGCTPPGHAIGLHVYEGSWVTGNENILVKTYFFIQTNFHLLLIFFILFFVFKKYVYTEYIHISK